MNNYSSNSTDDPQPSQGSTSSPNPGQQGGPRYNTNGAWQKPAQTFNTDTSAVSQPSAKANSQNTGTNEQTSDANQSATTSTQTQPGTNQQNQAYGAAAQDMGTQKTQPQQRPAQASQQPQGAAQSSSPYESPYATPTQPYSFDGYIGGQNTASSSYHQYTQNNGNPQPAYSAPAAQPYTTQYQANTQSYQTPVNATPAVAYVPVESNRWNTLCIVGFVLTFIIPPVGLVLSIIALTQINKTGEQSKGLSIAGIVISAIGTAVFVFIIVLIIVAISAATNDDNTYTDDDDCYYDEDCSSQEAFFGNDHNIQIDAESTGASMWAKPSSPKGNTGNVAETVYLNTTNLSQWL